MTDMRPSCNSTGSTRITQDSDKLAAMLDLAYRCGVRDTLNLMTGPERATLLQQASTQEG